MKNFLLAFLFIFLFTPGKINAVEQGDFVIQPTLNLGSWATAGWAGGGFGIGTTLNAQYAVHDYASVGAYFGFNTLTGLSGDLKFNRIGFGATGTFHFWQLIDDKASRNLLSDQIDFYLPVHLGYHFISYTLFKDPTNPYNTHTITSKIGKFRGGVGIGIRYYFNDLVGIAFETGGMEMSWAKIGVALKF